jgi:glyoxylase I family protein
VSVRLDNVGIAARDLDAALAIAARHRCHPLRGVATYEDVYRLTYVRGPSDILVMFAEKLRDTD